ncbi:MAG: ATP-binding protein [Candidatus Hydrogenedentes bacterium]|nr:ATP-binding protein [Candidatus Hydrogenedentota bacterium]
MNISDSKPITVRTPSVLKQTSLEDSLRDALVDCGILNIADTRSRYIVFDLSESYWYDLGALLWLIALLHRLKSQRNEVQLVFPEPSDSYGEKLWDFLIRWQFFDALSQCVDQPANLLQPSQLLHRRRDSQYSKASAKDEFGQETVLHTLRILEIKTVLAQSTEAGNTQSIEANDLAKQLQEFDRLEGRIIVGALSQLCGWDLQATRTFMQRVLREGICNSLLHANGTFVNFALRIDKKNLTLAIADNGTGIPHVLRTAFKSSNEADKERFSKSSDAELIKYFTEPEIILDSRLITFSTEENVTSQPSRAGVGLYYLKTHVLREGGEVRIRSGRACVDFVGSHALSRDSLLDSPGTLIRIQTPLRGKG